MGDDVSHLFKVEKKSETFFEMFILKYKKESENDMIFKRMKLK